MRDTCLYCARKHLAQAAALDSESRQGYPAHRWLAIGHLAEAGDELVKKHPKLAQAIHRHRKLLETNARHDVPYVELIERISSLEGNGMNGLFYGDPTLGQIGTSDMGEELNVRVGNQPQLLTLQIPKRPDAPPAPRIAAKLLERGKAFDRKQVQQFDVPLATRRPVQLRRHGQRPSTIQLPEPATADTYRLRVAASVNAATAWRRRAIAKAKEAERHRQQAVALDARAETLSKQASRASNLVRKKLLLVTARKLAAKGKIHAARANAAQAAATEFAAASKERTAEAVTNAAILQKG